MSFDGEAIVVLAIFIVGLAIAGRKKWKTKKRQKRFTCTKSWLRRQGSLGLYDILLSELRFADEEKYKKFPRMTPENFDELLGLIAADKAYRLFPYNF